MDTYKVLNTLTIFIAFLVSGCSSGLQVSHKEPVRERIPNINPPALHNASDNGNIPKIRSLLNLGADVNALHLTESFVPGLPEKRLGTPLIIGIFKGHIEAAKLLIESGGADVNLKDSDLVTPLHVAAADGNIEIAKMLLEHGANINARTIWEGTPLKWATEEDHKSVKFLTVAQPKIVKFLIEQGAYVNTANNKGYTPLHDAARHGNIKIAKILLEHGAHQNTRTKRFSHTPLVLAMLKGYFEVAKLLVRSEHTDITMIVGDRTSPLHAAAYNGNIEIAEILLKLGADPNAEDIDGLTPLEAAMKLKKRKFINYFGSALITEGNKKRVKDLNQIASSCPGGIADFATLFAIVSGMEGRISNRCFEFSGEVLQILDKSTALYQVSSKVFYLDFHGKPVATDSHDRGIRGRIPDFGGIVKGEGIFEYTTLRGFKKSVPKFSVIQRWNLDF